MGCGDWRAMRVKKGRVKEVSCISYLNSRDWEILCPEMLNMEEEQNWKEWVQHSA